MSEINCQQAKPPAGEIIPVHRATSSRNQGRHHLGLAGRHRRNPQGPAVCNVSDHKEGKDELINASGDLQDLRRRIYVKAKAEESNRRSQSRRELWLSGIRLPPHSQSSGRMARLLHAETQETNGAAAEAQNSVPTLPIATSRSGRAVDQSDTERVG